MTPFQDEIITEDLASSSPPRGFYRNSKGQVIPMGGMATPHLRSALAKMQREEPYRIGEIEDASVILQRRDEEYAATQAAEQSS